jgi:hypothetical protein
VARIGWREALGWTVELMQRFPEPAPKDVLMAWAESSGPIKE